MLKLEKTGPSEFHVIYDERFDIGGHKAPAEKGKKVGFVKRNYSRKAGFEQSDEDTGSTKYTAADGVVSKATGPFLLGQDPGSIPRDVFKRIHKDFSKAAASSESHILKVKWDALLKKNPLDWNESDLRGVGCSAATIDAWNYVKTMPWVSDNDDKERRLITPMELQAVLKKLVALSKSAKKDQIVRWTFPKLGIDGEPIVFWMFAGETEAALKDISSKTWESFVQYKGGIKKGEIIDAILVPESTSELPKRLADEMKARAGAKKIFSFSKVKKLPDSFEEFLDKHILKYKLATTDMSAKGKFMGSAKSFHNSWKKANEDSPMPVSPEIKKMANSYRDYLYGLLKAESSMVIAYLKHCQTENRPWNVIIVDDNVSSGATVKNIIDELNIFSDGAKLLEKYKDSLEDAYLESEDSVLQSFLEDILSNSFPDLQEISASVVSPFYSTNIPTAASSTAMKEWEKIKDVWKTSN